MRIYIHLRSKYISNALRSGSSILKYIGSTEMKWADYVISAVRYTKFRDGKRYIAKCRVHLHKTESIGPFSEWSRKEVIKMIDNGASLSTIYKNNGQWKKGEVVRKIKLGIYYYIKTDRNNIEQDNLENLPEF